MYITTDRYCAVIDPELWLANAYVEIDAVGHTKNIAPRPAQRLDYRSLVGTVLRLFQTGGILALPNKQKSTLIFRCFHGHLSRFQYIDN